jgi:hypothetical protein
VGDQRRDGRVGRYIEVTRLPVLIAAEARQLARVLIAASDELDSLSDADARVEE